MDAAEKRTGIIIITLVMVIIIAMTAVFVNVSKLVKPTEQEIFDSVTQYEQVFGQSGKFVDAFAGDVSVFPEVLPESAKAETFYAEYFKPLNANYFAYLVYTCSEADYAEEANRLNNIKSTPAEDRKIYGINIFTYPVLAAFADKEDGIVYAMGDEENLRIIYFALAFENYATNIEYKKHVKAEYLPDGFDAYPGNASYDEYKKENAKD